MKKLYPIMVIFLIIVTFGCQSGSLSKSSLGTGAGAVIGALGGKMFGDGKTEAVLIGAAAGGLIGNRIGKYLEEQDKQKLAQSSQDALKTGKTQTWNNPESKNSGRVEVVGEKQEQTNIKVKVLKDRVKTVPPLEMADQRYRVKSNSNLRGGPSSQYKVLMVLNSGTIVDAIGKVQDKPWMMVGQNQVGNGFIHTSLLAPAPEDAASSDVFQQQNEAKSEIAEESVTLNRTCRTVKQTVILADGTEQEEEITACQGPNGWETM